MHKRSLLSCAFSSDQSLLIDETVANEEVSTQVVTDAEIKVTETLAIT